MIYKIYKIQKYVFLTFLFVLVSWPIDFDFKATKELVSSSLEFYKNIIFQKYFLEIIFKKNLLCCRCCSDTADDDCQTKTLWYKLHFRDSWINWENLREKIERGERGEDERDLVTYREDSYNIIQLMRKTYYSLGNVNKS